MPATAVYSEILEAALEYARIGLKVLPLKEHGKVPILEDWPSLATSDVEVIQKWWGNGRNNYNVGVKLGLESGILDFECDSKEAEQDLLDLFDGDLPVTPTYLAARGKHRLFATSGGLPLANVIKYRKLEIRLGMLGGVQSVFPPSLHESGIKYTWIEGLSILECTPPPLPPKVLEKIGKLAKQANRVGKQSSENLKELLKGVCQGTRANSAASVAGYVLAHLTELNGKTKAILEFFMRAWNERNDPPLDDKELQHTINSIWTREASYRAEHGPPWMQKPSHGNNNTLEASKQTEQQQNDESDQLKLDENGFFEGPNCTQWRLSAINYSGNHKFVIESSLFGDIKVELTARDIISTRLTSIAILEQTASFPPTWFEDWWPQIVREAIRSCQIQTAEHDQTSVGILAGVIIDYVNRMRLQQKDSEKKDIPVLPSLLAKFAKEQGVQASPEEIGKLLSKVGAKREQSRAKIFGEPTTPRYVRVITQEILGRLSELT